MQFYKCNKLDNYYEIIRNKLGNYYIYGISLLYARERKYKRNLHFHHFILFSYYLIFIS